MIFKAIQYFVILFGIIPCFGISIGSNTAVSREARAIFPLADSNNTMLGFAEFANGFEMEVGATCTFNDLFPVEGDVSFGSGIFTLQKDINFHNTTNFYRGGHIMGHNHAFQCDDNASYYLISKALSRTGDLRFVTRDSMVDSVDTAAWSVNRTYIAAGCFGTTSPQLKVYTFDGSTLTLTSNGSVNMATSVNEIRWHPTSYYLATCRAVTAGNELQIYERRIYNGTLVNTGGIEIGFDALSCDWHKNGGYLVVGTANPTSQLRLYSFSGGSLTLTQSIYLSPSVALNTDIIRWAPDGHYVAVGTQLNTGPELRIFYFNGSTLTYTANAEVGLEIAALDWSPSGTFIVVGLTGGTSNVRVFSHKVWNGTVTEEATARIGITSLVNGVYWTRDGNGLLCATANGASSQVQLHTFNKTAKTCTFVNSYNFSVNANFVFTSHDGLYASVGTEATSNNLNIFTFDSGLQPDPYYFRDTAITIKGTIVLTVPWYFEGTCVLDIRNYAIVCMMGGALIVRPGANLTIKNAFIGGQTSKQLYCMTNNGSITLENCDWVLANDYTFSRGALQFVGDNIFSGSNKFIYAASRTSTIATHSKLQFDVGTTFSYDPANANRNLLYLTDKTSDLYFFDASLYVTSTGLTLSGGRLFIDNKVTFSCNGRNLAEGIIFDSTLDTNLLGAAILDIYGPAKFL